MPSTIGFRVFLPFFSRCQPMPSSRPFLVQPWFQLLMPSTSPHFKSRFKGLWGPKRSGSLEKDQNHILGKQSRQSWGFPYPLQIPSENALRRCPKKTHHHCAHDSSTLQRQCDWSHDSAQDVQSPQCRSTVSDCKVIFYIMPPPPINTIIRLHMPTWYCKQCPVLSGKNGGVG